MSSAADFFKGFVWANVDCNHKHSARKRQAHLSPPNLIREGYADKIFSMAFKIKEG